MLTVIRISALLFVLWGLTCPVSAGAIIVNANVKADSVSRQFMLSIFSMRVNRWLDGAEINVFVLPDRAPEHLLFTKRYLGIFPYQLRNIWDRSVFTGSGFPPQVVESNLEMIQKVAATEGSVGYVDSVGQDMDGVRVLYEY